ncbi:MAG: phosphoglycerate kinase [Phycisphaerae bacterium]|nr:phosphoglycerate kinase [Phycisphaerae bacterium]MBM91876.1 phosphoglycerate kinase [Phycisphaerae bacterium]HCT46222.1 phosphoglycerate kinase [Phycisphaerales bacterium]
MAKQSIEHTEVAGKRVLIRVDFNVPLDGGTISDDQRITAALPTIKSVIDRGGRAVLMSHLGRPEGKGFEASQSMAPVAKRLGELLGKEVKIPAQTCKDPAVKAAVDAMNDGEVLLLENLRFHGCEKRNEPEFAKQLADLADVYVNDAFGTCHREHTSMVGVPAAMGGKPKVAGLLVQKELAYLQDALSSPAQPFTVILGGAKVSDKLPAIEHLLPKADHILVGGAMAYTFLQALGHNVGTSRVEADMVKEAKRIIELAAESKTDLHFPEDHICSTLFSESAGDIEIFDDQIKDGYMGLDIGSKTAARYSEIIKSSKTIVWNGPMGVFEWRPFKMGTKLVAEAVADATDGGATSIVGGGDSAAAAEQFGVAPRLSHVSTGGGASLAMLEGKRFKAVDLLDDA